MKPSNTSQAMWIAIGSFGSYGFSLVSTAILSRYLIKEDYGTYKQVMYVYNILLLVFTLGLPRAYSYFLPRVPIEMGKSLINKLNSLFFALGLLFTLVLYFSSSVISSILKNPDLNVTIKIFAPSALFLLYTLGLEGVLASYQKALWNALYVLCTRVLMLVCVALPVALYRSDSITAIWGYTISSFISFCIAFVFYRIPFRGQNAVKCNISYNQIFKFSIPLMFAGFWNILGDSADQFFVSRFFGKAVFAEFANGFIDLPFVGMILSAGATVLLPVASKMVSEGNEYKEVIDIWKRSIIKASYLMVPIVVFSWFFATEIITLLYGDQYSNSVSFFRIRLVIGLFSVMQFYPIVLAFGKTKAYSNIILFTAILVCSAEYIAISIMPSPYTIAIVSVICTLLKMFLFTLLIGKCVKAPIYTFFPIKDFIMIFIDSFIVAGVIYFTLSQMPFCTISIVRLLLGFPLYALLIVITGPIIKIDYLEPFLPLIKSVLNAIKIKL